MGQEGLPDEPPSLAYRPPGMKHWHLKKLSWDIVGSGFDDNSGIHFALLTVSWCHYAVSAIHLINEEKETSSAMTPIFEKALNISVPSRRRLMLKTCAKIILSFFRPCLGCWANHRCHAITQNQDGDEIISAVENQCTDAPTRRLLFFRLSWPQHRTRYITCWLFDTWMIGLPETYAEDWTGLS